MSARIDWLGVSVSAAVAFLVLMSTAAGAQTVGGSMFGAVSDSAGGRLPGVSVSVASPQLIGGQQVTVTGERGTYRFASLPPGTYTVTFELAGFQTLQREGIVLLAGQSLPLDAELQIAGVQETVTVSGEAPLIDTRNSALVNVLDSSDLEELPLPRQYVYLLNIMPGVSDSKYNFAPMNVVHGAAVRQNVYSVDGFNLNDSNTGSSATELPVDSLQEVQLVTAGVSAEFRQGSGAVFTFVSKSGGDQFSGGANFHTQGRNTQSNNIDDELRRQGLTSAGGFEHVYDTSLFLGGPLKRGKIWFFTNYRYLSSEERQSDFPEPNGQFDHQFFGKGTVQISDGQRVEASYHSRDWLNYPYTARSNFRTAGDPRTWSGLRTRPDLYAGRYWAALSDRTFLDVRASKFVWYSVGESPNNDGSAAYQDLVTGVYTGGTDLQVGPTERNRNQLMADLSHFVDDWFGGTHNFKLGVHWENTPNLSTLWQLGARSEVELEGCGEGCLSEVPDALHLLFNGAPFRVRLFNTPSVRSYQFRSLSGFVQDQWVIGDRVTLNLGARLDRTTGVNKESSFGGGFWDPLTVFPEETAVEFTTIAPRFGVVWDVSGDHKTTVKGSAGRFYADGVGNWLRDSNPGGYGFREYDWVDHNGDLKYQVGEETLLRSDRRPDPNRLPRFDSDFKNQYSNVFTIGLERQVKADLAFSVTGIFKREGDLVGIIDEAIPFSAYDRVTVTNPLTSEPLQVFTLRPEFLGTRGQVLVTNPGEAPDGTRVTRRYNGIELVLTKKMDRNWQLQTSYVYGRAKGSVSNSFAGSVWAQLTNPNSFINRFGPLPLDQPHQFKLYGSYLAPYGVMVSGFFQAVSGLPLTDSLQGFVQETPKGAAVARFFRADFPQILSETFIDVAVEPAGTRRHDAQTKFDLRVEKSFQVGWGRFAASADLFNLFNANTVVRVRDLRLDSPNFGVPAEIMPPRQLRVGLRWEF